MGERIADRFRLEAEAGRGGMGVVYRAIDEADGATVALKLLTGDDAVDVSRFEREAGVLARLAHPHVVRHVAHGQTPHGRVYLAMEWLEGETLAERLTRARPSVTEAVRIVAGAAAGLGAAHAAGIVHRDVKPANLFLVDGDPARLRVLDFGIARAIGAGHTLTTTGTVVGTPYYMAPEQARADAGVDARADVYALGAVLYELLAGSPPFRNESLMATLAAILLEEPVDVRRRAGGVPEAVAALTMRLLDKDPDTRPADGAALRALVDGLGAHPDRGASSHAPPALTEREQRVLCLVLAAPGADALATGATLAPGERDAMGRLRAAVDAHGGRLERLADGSMVARVEGAGSAADQAVRAAHCAAAMRSIVPDLPLAVVAGRGHFQGPIPVGEVIQRGSALLMRASGGAATLPQGALGGARPGGAEAWPVRLDDAMAGLLQGRFAIHREAGGATLGEELTTPTTDRTLLGRPSPCVGRRRELATLEAIYAEAAEEPVARAVVLEAAAGMGKTRLVTELLDRLRAGDGGRPSPAVWMARGDPLAAGSPFALVSELVRAAAGIREGEPIEERRRKLVAALVDRVPPDRLAAVAARLGDLARTPFEERDVSRPPDDPKLRGDAMREAFLSWLAAVLDDGPLLLVVDDLQWGDAPSLTLLDAALRELADRPLMIVAAGRPEVQERFGELWAERDAQPMRLTRLRPKAAERLIRSGLGDDADAALVARLIERADGNPFFLEELVRALAEGEGESDLPTTVLGMVEARLAVLEAATRRVLRAASVFGRRFWRGGVVALLGGSERAGDVDAHLDVLRLRELVDRVEASRFAGERELAFRHALTREAAHAMLTDEDRRLGHRLAGRWLEAAGERDALVLSAHYARGGEEGEAARWLGRAAEQALEGDDLSGAIERGERALRGLEGEARGPVLVTLADAHRWRGEYERALARAQEATEALVPGARPWFRALGVIFAAAGRLGRGEEAERWRRRAMEAAAERGAEGAQVVALCRAATVALANGDRPRFEATMAHAEGLAQRGARDEPLARAWIRTLRASEALRDGDHGAFVDGTAAAVEAYEAAGDPRDACNQKVRLGNGYVGLGDPEQAQRVLQEALASARRMGLPLVTGYALQNLGHALLRAGALDEARGIEERAAALARTIDDPVLEAGCLLYAAEARELAGDADGATEDARRAVALLDAVPPFRAVARAVLGRALLAAGDARAALDEAASAAEALERHDVEEGEALVRLVHAEALAANERHDEAAEVAAEARRRLEARAARITDRGWRDAFLHRVPVHARLLALAPT